MYVVPYLLLSPHSLTIGCILNIVEDGDGEGEGRGGGGRERERETERERGGGEWRENLIIIRALRNDVRTYTIGF